MSRQSKAVAKFRGWGKRAGHSNRTKTTYMNILRRFVKQVFRDLGTPIDGPDDITESLLKHFVALLVLIGNSARTIQNKLSVIRRVLILAGRVEMATSPTMRSAALGAPRGSRDGTNIATEPDEYAWLLRVARKVGEPGLAPILKLQWTIGLRRQEAVMAGPWLKIWERRLMLGLPLPIRDGAKNGRPRDVVIPDIDAALEAVRAARAVAEAQDGHLIQKPSLRQALARYSNLMSAKVGKKGHGLRYAFAKKLYFHFRDQGLSEDEAWPLVSDSLGHGIHREDLMRCVYLRDVIPRKQRRRAA